MNLSFLRKILKRIAGKTHCPECDGSLEMAALRHIQTDGSRSIFEATCSTCQTTVDFKVETQRIPEHLLQQAMMPRRQQDLSAQTPLSPENIHEIGQTLHQFRGKDVRELFGS